jgi:hypothetical protein
MSTIARRVERLEAESGTDTVEIVIRRFGDGPLDPPHEILAPAGRRIIVTQERASP